MSVRQLYVALGGLLALEVISMTDWQPVVVALAAFIGALTTAVPVLLLLAQHGTTLARVEQSTNGSMTALRAEVARLNAALLARSDAAPPSSSTGTAKP